MAADVDFPFLARQLELSGGNIRNVVLAAAESRPIAMPDFIAAAARELRKIGRLPGRAEFGEYYDVVCEVRL